MQFLKILKGGKNKSVCKKGNPELDFFPQKAIL